MTMIIIISSEMRFGFCLKIGHVSSERLDCYFKMFSGLSAIAQHDRHFDSDRSDLSAF